MSRVPALRAGDRQDNRQAVACQFVVGDDQRWPPEALFVPDPITEVAQINVAAPDRTALQSLSGSSPSASVPANRSASLDTVACQALRVARISSENAASSARSRERSVALARVVWSLAYLASRPDGLLAGTDCSPRG